MSGAAQFVVGLKDRAYKYICKTILTTSCSSILKLSPFFRVQNQEPCPYKTEVVKNFYFKFVYTQLTDRLNIPNRMVARIFRI